MSTFYASDTTVDNDSFPLSVGSHRDWPLDDVKQQLAYDGLESARRTVGVARIVIGLHLVTLQDTNGWQGRSGAKSFRRFLLEEGMQPAAVYQYMIVARTFLLEHAVAPERIASVSMRLLVVASRYLHLGDASNGFDANTEEIIAIVTSMPTAEALQAIQERFELNDEVISALDKPKVSRPVANILNSVEGLTHDGRAELYQALRFRPPMPKRPNTPTNGGLITTPPVIGSMHPFFLEGIKDDFQQTHH